MSPATPVYFKTPDGVERELRFTFGARKRIVDRLGLPLHAALKKYDGAALPEILYCCMFDDKGNPPDNLDVAQFLESKNLGGDVELLATIMAAANQGRTPKNEIEALLRQAIKAKEKTSTGTTSGLSPSSASNGAAPPSGNSPSGNLTRSANDIESESTLKTTVQV